MNIELATEFLHYASYSFGDPAIMINHAIMVRDLALQIEENVHCDQNLLSIMALFHDIGKAYETDQQTLREKHAELGYEVTKDFIPTLKLGDNDRTLLVSFLKGDMSSLQAQIIKDADIIAFFADERLQKALKEWGDKNALPNELQRKANKIADLKFEVSVKIARPFYEQLVARWDLEAKPQ